MNSLALQVQEAMHRDPHSGDLYVFHRKGGDLFIPWPSMNGAQFATEAAKLWPSAPMLFITRFAANDALRPWTERGYQTVAKPFTTHDLALAIERAVQRPEPAVT